MAISSAMGSAGAVPVGVVNPFAGATAPSGWLLCYGQAVSRTQYSALFAVLNTTYGAGDGSTTFTLPDMRGRSVSGKDNMGGSTAGRITAGTTGVTGTTLGSAGGTQNPPLHNHSNTLTNNTVASSTHRHEFGFSLLDNYYSAVGSYAGMGVLGQAGAYRYSTGQWQGAVGNGTVTDTRPTPTGATLGTSGRMSSFGDTEVPNATTTVGIFNNTAGSGTSGNLPPTIILNYIIKAQ